MWLRGASELLVVKSVLLLWKLNPKKNHHVPHLLGIVWWSASYPWLWGQPNAITTCQMEWRTDCRFWGVFLCCFFHPAQPHLPYQLHCQVGQLASLSTEVTGSGWGKRTVSRPIGVLGTKFAIYAQLDQQNTNLVGLGYLGLTKCFFLNLFKAVTSTLNDDSQGYYY